MNCDNILHGEHEFDDDELDELRAEDSISNVPSVSSSSTSSTLISNTTRTNRNRISTVWTHFDKTLPTHPGMPVCNICKAVFSVNSGVSTLRKHLNTHSIEAPKKQQQTLHEYRTDPHPMIEQKKRDKAIEKWIICDLQSFSVVEGLEWREMVSTLDPRYKFHNRHTLHDRIMGAYEEKRQLIRTIVNRMPGKVSFTADMWTAKNNAAFLSLTIHYIDEEWAFKTFLLDIIPMAVRHTGLNMAEAIINVLNEHNLSSKALALTTDNASAMLVCGRTIANELADNFSNLNFTHYRCAAHILNLAVQQGLQQISEIIGKVRSMMTYLRSSAPTITSLKTLCILKGINYRAPVMDCPTRWNSTYYMLKNFEHLQPALQMLQADNTSVRDRYPSQSELLDIHCIIVLLEPIERATLFLSASKYPTHGDIRLCFLAILENLENESFTQSAAAIGICNKLKDYWPILDRTSQISAIFDPRSKLSAFKNDEEKEQGKAAILELTSYCNSLLSNVEERTEDEVVDVRNYFRQLLQRNAAINTDGSIVHSNSEATLTSSSNSSMYTNERLLIYAELSRYLSAPLEDKVDPLLWWHAQQSVYPILSLMARDYLSVQATSVASEQAFSVAGQAITSQRNRLDPDTARASLCLRSWTTNNICSY